MISNEFAEKLAQLIWDNTSVQDTAEEIYHNVNKYLEETGLDEINHNHQEWADYGWLGYGIIETVDNQTMSMDEYDDISRYG